MFSVMAEFVFLISSGGALHCRVEGQNWINLVFAACIYDAEEFISFLLNLTWCWTFLPFSKNKAASEVWGQHLAGALCDITSTFQKKYRNWLLKVTNWLCRGGFCTTPDIRLSGSGASSKPAFSLHVNMLIEIPLWYWVTTTQRPSAHRLIKNKAGEERWPLVRACRQHRGPDTLVSRMQSEGRREDEDTRCTRARLTWSDCRRRRIRATARTWKRTRGAERKSSLMECVLDKCAAACSPCLPSDTSAARTESKCSQPLMSLSFFFFCCSLTLGHASIFRVARLNFLFSANDCTREKN